MTTKNTTKKVMKKNVKIVPQLIVNLTDAIEASDVYFAFADAKCDKYLTRTEYDTLMTRMIDNFEFDVCICGKHCPFCGDCKAKKPNVFKRFWNWITRKK